MSTEARINTTQEFPTEFLRELRINGQDTHDLQRAVTDPIVCNYSTVNNLLKTPAMREAAAPVREQPPASSTRRRPSVQFVLNTEALYFDLTSQSLPAVRSTNNLPVTNKLMALYSPMGSYDSILTLGANNIITINQTGMYRITANLSFAFYPKGMTTNADSINWTGKSDNSLTQSIVQVYLAIKVGSNTRYEMLSEMYLSRSDFTLGRARTAAGFLNLQLAAGNTVSFMVARGPTMGVMTAPDQADKDEVLGLRKTKFVVPGSNPNRDACNTLDIMLLA